MSVAIKVKDSKGQSFIVNLLQVIRNTEDNHSKEYLVIEAMGGYYASWGVIGERNSSLGTRTFNDVKHYWNTVRKKLNEGYRDISINDSVIHEIEQKLTDVLALPFPQQQLDILYGTKAGLTPNPPQQVKGIKSGAWSQVDEDKVKRKLSELKRYVSFNPEDLTYLRIAKEIGSLKNMGEVIDYVNDDVEKEMRRLEDKVLMSNAYLIIQAFKDGSNVFRDALETLRGYDLTKTLKGEEIALLRTLWEADHLTLGRLEWSVRIFGMLEVFARAVAKPFNNPFK